MESDEGIKILVIEDDPADAELVREMLRDVKGIRFDIQRATRLSSAIQRLKRESFDIILSDLDLPDSKGTDTFRKVHAEFSDIPVVLLTGLSDEELAIQAVRDGAQDYLVKGRIESNLLVRSIRYAMERQKLLTRLDKSLREIRTLRGLIPMCAWCRKIRDDEGYWKNVETYIEEHTHAAFSHGICPACMKKDQPELYEKLVRDQPELRGKEKEVRQDEDIGLKVLLIEDDAGDAAHLRALLSDIKSCRTELILTDRLSEGLERLNREKVDIVLLDLGLPDSLGIETFVRVHASYPHAPIIVLTGLHDEDLAMKALRSGAQDYLVKGHADSGLLLKSMFYAIERNRLMTEVKNKLDEIRRLERERKNMLSMFAHDIMNAVVPSIGLLTGILSGKVQNPDVDIALVRDSLTEAEDLLANFVEFSKFEAEKYIPKVVPVGMDAIIRRRMESARIKAEEKNIRISAELSGDPLPQMTADEAMINRVVANLLDNAIKYSKSGGTIRIRVFNRGRDILVQIIDTGTGIPENRLPYIFDAFYRATSNERGSGLGLSIARSIIESHGGNIWAESTPGKGSTFSFILPK